MVKFGSRSNAYILEGLIQSKIDQNAIAAYCTVLFLKETQDMRLIHGPGFHLQLFLHVEAMEEAAGKGDGVLGGVDGVDPARRHEECVS